MLFCVTEQAAGPSNFVATQVQPNFPSPFIWCPSTSNIFMHHYNDVIMNTVPSQITSLTSVYSTVYSDADQRKHQSSASLAFVREIHRRPVNSPHKWPVTRKIFPFDDVIMIRWHIGYFLTGEMPHAIKLGATDNHRNHDDVIQWKHFPRNWPFVWGFDVFFDLRLNKRLNKQSRGWWFETQSRSLWRHCNKLSTNWFFFGGGGGGGGGGQHIRCDTLSPRWVTWSRSNGVQNMQHKLIKPFASKLTYCINPTTHQSQCTSPITPKNAPFCNKNVHICDICAHFCYKTVHCGMFVWCIVGFVRWVSSQESVATVPDGPHAAWIKWMKLTSIWFSTGVRPRRLKHTQRNHSYTYFVSHVCTYLYCPFDMLRYPAVVNTNKW